MSVMTAGVGNPRMLRCKIYQTFSLGHRQSVHIGTKQDAGCPFADGSHQAGRFGHIGKAGFHKISTELLVDGAAAGFGFDTHFFQPLCHVSGGFL